MNTSRLKKLDSNKVYDTIIIGGGITGANILWDLTLRGLDCILFEKNDYASGTSQATSKLIHGGLRYLKNAEFGLVRESLRERRILGKLTPHSIRPMGFIIPIYDFKNKFLLKAGLTLYDMLSFDRNKELSSDAMLPGHEFLSRERIISEDPGIPREGLKGGFLYYDYANVNPERHTAEFIFSAKSKGQHAFNYSELISIEKKEELYSITVLDKMTSEKFNFSTRSLVNSTGPWADSIDSMVDKNTDKHIIRSKGIHIVVRNITGRHTTVIQTKDKKHLFIIPWRGKTLIGTTDTVYDDSPDNFQVNRKDIDTLINQVNNYLNFKITSNDVDYYFGGLRPLVEDSSADTKNTYDASRKTEIIDHSKFGKKGYFTAMGGKYTTSRGVAETVSDMITKYLGKGSGCKTKTENLISGGYTDIPNLIKDLKSRFIDMSNEKAYYLTNRYGKMTEMILTERNSNEAEPIFRLNFGNREPYYHEEIVYIVRNEDIMDFSDLLFRRTGIGNTGLPDESILNKLIKIYEKEKEEKVSEETLTRIKKRYQF
ncbi:MAG: glycerol-3-phosphate dehydrogenase/oxidase [Leptospiraceae bacterium]|nr:glycerol-3-phosphate dehydrogenase/oxidase [Leptospiraceae bacterium]